MKSFISDIMQKQTHDKINNLRKSSQQNRKNNVDFSRCINYRYGISNNCINYTMKLIKKYPYKHYNRFSDTTGRKYLVDNKKYHQLTTILSATKDRLNF